MYALHFLRPDMAATHLHMNLAICSSTTFTGVAIIPKVPRIGRPSLLARPNLMAKWHDGPARLSLHLGAGHDVLKRTVLITRRQVVGDGLMVLS